MPKLSDEDRLAIDVILMNGHYTQNPDGTASAVAAAPDGLAARVTAASNLLQLLDTLPVPEVPDDLAHRTLERIRAAGDATHAPAGADQPRLPATNDPNVA